MIDVTCNDCGHAFQAGDYAAGRTIDCPRCKAKNRVADGRPVASTYRIPTLERQLLRAGLYVMLGLYLCGLGLGLLGIVISATRDSTGGGGNAASVLSASLLGLAVCLTGLAASARRHPDG